MTDMIEKVARAIEPLTEVGVGVSLVKLSTKQNEVIAKAAITAMLEPTDEMVGAGLQKAIVCGEARTPLDATTALVYTAAIQQALKE